MIAHVRTLLLGICCVLLVACDDADDEQQPSAIGMTMPARPAPNPKRESLDISPVDKNAVPTSLSRGPRFELFSQYSGQDIKQVTGVSGRTMWLCFTAPWCPYSREMIKALKIMARNEKGSVQIVEINADAYPALAEEFGITKVPTTVLYAEGVKLRTIEGAYNAPSLQRYLHSILSRGDEPDAAPTP